LSEIVTVARDSAFTPHPNPPPQGGSGQIAPATLDYATPSLAPKPQRLVSLDVFRGLVILAMLIVNNLGDSATTGYFWKHADWPAMSMPHAWRAWWGYATGSPAWQQRPSVLRNDRDRLLVAAGIADGFSLDSRLLLLNQGETYARAVDEELRLATSPWSHFPLFTYCTLADYVMPSFMLIIGVAIPFSVAAAKARGTHPAILWLRTIKRAAMLVILGWIIVYFRDQFEASLHRGKPWTFSLGMDVLQLLGVGYLVARILYELPTKPRTILAAVLLLWHWAILRFYPQGVAPRGTFTEQYEAIGYIYHTWPIWDWMTAHVGPVTIGWRGLMSVPPAAAMMLIGSLMGDFLRRSDIDAQRKVARLSLAGFALATVGIFWALDLPFNKPRWTSCYIVYVAGVDAILIAILYSLIDIHEIRGWTYPLIVFGTNAIAVYFISILAKILLLNTPYVNGESHANQLVMKYGTLIFCTLVIGACAAWFIRWARREFGDAAFAIIAIVLLPVAVMWMRFSYVPADLLIKGTNSIGTHALTILKGCLGPWWGGWMFTITFIAFWWLVMDQMHRRKIFWKL
jgi:predicted acyltransferase